MEKENLESVMRRIQKLLAIAGDDRANPEEASAAAGMAERIMRKYQLEHSDIILESLRKGDDMHSEDCVASAKTNGTKVVNVPPWANWLAVQCARVNDCGVKLARTKSGDVGVRFYGFKSDVMVAKYTFEYLVATLLRLCNEFKKTPQYIDRSSVDSYRKGVSTGMYQNLKNQVKQKEQENRTSSAGTALVVAKGQAVAEYGGEFRTKKSKSTTNDHNAFGAGVRDGKQVDVNRRGVTHSSGSVKLLG